MAHTQSLRYYLFAAWVSPPPSPLYPIVWCLKYLRLHLACSAIFLMDIELRVVHISHSGSINYAIPRIGLPTVSPAICTLPSVIVLNTDPCRLSPRHHQSCPIHLHCPSNLIAHLFQPQLIVILNGKGKEANPNS